MGNRSSVQTPFFSLISLAGGMIASVRDGILRRELMEALAITYHEIGESARAHAMLVGLIKEEMIENAGRNLSDIICAARRCGMSRRRILELIDQLAGHGDPALEKRVDRIARRLVLQRTMVAPAPAVARADPGALLVRDPMSLAYVKNLALRGDISRLDVALERLLCEETRSSCAHAKAMILLAAAGELRRGGHSFKAEQTLKRARLLMDQEVAARCHLAPQSDPSTRVCPHYAPAAMSLLELYRSKGRHEELLSLVATFLRMEGGGFAPYAANCVRLYLPQQYGLAHRLLDVFPLGSEAYAAALDEFVRYHYERGEIELLAAFLDLMPSDERRIWSLATEICNVEDGYHDNILRHFESLRSYVAGHLLAAG